MRTKIKSHFSLNLKVGKKYFKNIAIQIKQSILPLRIFSQKWKWKNKVTKQKQDEFHWITSFQFCIYLKGAIKQEIHNLAP